MLNVDLVGSLERHPDILLYSKAESSEQRKPVVRGF
jgi:hypothetical protein